MVNRFCQQCRVAFSLSISALLLFYFIPLATADELPFKVGEKLVYEANWLFMKPAMAISEISETITDEGGKLYHFHLHTTTNNLVAKIWKMDDNFDSYWDTKLKAPRLLKIKIRESTYKKDKEVRLDHEKGIAIVKQNSDEPKEFKILKGSQDFFTAGHYARTLPLKTGETYQYPVFEDNDNYMMRVKVYSRKRIRLFGGKIDTIYTDVKVRFEGAFSSRGSLKVWYTDDKHKVPVQMRLNSVFGSILLRLVHYEGVELNIVGAE